MVDMLGSGTTLAFQPLASMYAASSSVIPTRAFASESKMESNGRAGMEKSLCGNGLLQGSIPPAPARHMVALLSADARYLAAPWCGLVRRIHLIGFQVGNSLWRAVASRWCPQSMGDHT